VSRAGIAVQFGGECQAHSATGFEIGDHMCSTTNFRQKIVYLTRACSGGAEIIARSRSVGRLLLALLCGASIYDAPESEAQLAAGGVGLRGL
jgi:hypothetical protein